MECVVNATPGHSTPGKQTLYLLYRRLGGSQSRSGWVRKISLPPGFDPRTVQTVAICHTDWTIPAHNTTMAFDISPESLTVRDCNKVSSSRQSSQGVKVLRFRDKIEHDLGFTKPPGYGVNAWSFGELSYCEVTVCRRRFYWTFVLLTSCDWAIFLSLLAVAE
jgi:hypothetical protein